MLVRKHMIWVLSAALIAGVLLTGYNYIEVYAQYRNPENTTIYKDAITAYELEHTNSTEVKDSTITKEVIPETTVEIIVNPEAAPANQPEKPVPSVAPTPTSNPTQAALEASCRARLSDLQDEASFMLIWLKEEAKKEYHGLSEADRKNADIKSKLVTKYIAIAQSFEDRTDSKFDQIINEFQSDLSAYGYSTDILTEFRKEYAAQKKALLPKMLNQINP